MFAHTHRYENLYVTNKNMFISSQALYIWLYIVFFFLFIVIHDIKPKLSLHFIFIRVSLGNLRNHCHHISRYISTGKYFSPKNNPSGSRHWGIKGKGTSLQELTCKTICSMKAAGASETGCVQVLYLIPQYTFLVSVYFRLQLHLSWLLYAHSFKNTISLLWFSCVCRVSTMTKLLSLGRDVFL